MLSSCLAPIRIGDAMVSVTDHSSGVIITRLAFLVCFLLPALPAAAQRTARVCGQDGVSFEDCYTIDTSTIAGIRFTDFRVRTPVDLVLNLAARRGELASVDAETLARYSGAGSWLAPLASRLPAVNFASSE